MLVGIRGATGVLVERRNANVAPMLGYASPTAPLVMDRADDRLYLGAIRQDGQYSQCIFRL